MNHSTKRRDSSGSDISASRIPISRSASLSNRQKGRLERHRSLQCLSTLSRGRSPKYDDDTESLRSAFSGCSNTSQCDHAHFARNGTTYSGRAKKYIVHCSPPQVDMDNYLTPTQRANQTIRRLQSLLSESHATLVEKEQEIARLTKDLVELRLGKAEGLSNGHSPGGGFDETRLTVDLVGRHSLETTPCSLADSGHFEELSPHPSPRNTPNGLQEASTNGRTPSQQSLNVKSRRESPETTSSKTDTLVLRLYEANERYYELKPQYDNVIKKLEELQKQKDELQLRFSESEERHKKTYLQMFNKGQEAAIFQVDDSPEGPSKAQNLPKLLKELEVTKLELESVKTMYRRLLESKKSKSEQDAEVTLQFLKSAFYYFLTDRENTTGHLAAIQSILGFTQDEKLAIEKASYGWK